MLVSVTPARYLHPHGLTVCKCLQEKGKSALSTEKYALYYYNYLEVIPIEE
jgi:hypothetical protein